MYATSATGVVGEFRCRWRRTKKQPKSNAAMRSAAPPIAIPAIAPVESFFAGAVGGAELVALGMARVGVRTANEAFWLK